MSTLGQLLRIAVFSTWRDARAWWGFGILIVLSATIIAVATAGLETSSGLSGRAGGVIRSWVTPAAAFAVLSASLVMGRISRLTHEQLHRQRTTWWSSGVLPSQGRVLITVQTLIVAGAAAAIGTTCAWIVVLSFGSLELAGSVIRPAFGSVVPVGVIVATMLIVAPSLIAELRRFGRPDRGPHIAGRVWSAVIVSGLTIWISIVVMGSDPDSIASVSSVLPLEFVILVGCVIVVAFIGGIVVRGGLACLDRCLFWVPWRVVRLAVRRAHVSADAVLPTVMISGITGGVLGILRAADEVLRIHHIIRPDQSTVGETSVVVISVAPVLICLAASTVTYVITGRGRTAATRVLITLGATDLLLVCVALLDAAVIWLVGVAVGGVLVGATIAPLFAAGGVPGQVLLRTVCNPAFLGSAGGAGVLMFTTAVGTQMLSNRAAMRART